MTQAEKEWDIYSGKYRTYIKLERGLADNTVESYMRDLRRFRRFVTERYRLSPLDVDAAVVEDFMASLFEDGAEKSTQGRTLSGVNSFYDFLLRTDVLAKSPTEFVAHPKTRHVLPDTLSVGKIDAILDAMDVSTGQGYRNRTMIEMLYSCGLRVSELTSLHISDLFFDEGFIRVLGKGSKQRLVPVSDRCRMQVETYLREYRGRPGDEKSADTVFLNRHGQKLSRIMVFNIIKAAVAAAGIDRDVSPHTFRHSFATHLLQGGANIRQVQELLGHESIATTEIYTHLDTGHLHRTLNENHPLGKRYGRK
ncbi:MAG TPA: tyrosine recombinase XerD [Candidatus Tidjanibacter gallistercoris]|nr:tyrosine recombinase XerD [Candidatus Tidjanibacter gallistercoris]